MIHPAPLELSGVVHLLRPAGARAEDVASLRAALSAATPGELFQHTVIHRLRFPSAREPAADDFSHWVDSALQNHELAERMSFSVQDRGQSAEATRAALLDALSAESASRTNRAPEGGAFVFLEAESVRVPTGIVVERPNDLFEALTGVDASVWFYHLIERPWFGDASLSFATWLRAHHDGKRAAWFDEAVTPYHSLAAGREAVFKKWRRSLVGVRAIDAARQPEPERREAGRSAVASFVRRLKTVEDES